MKTDMQIKRDVLDQLAGEPSVTASAIGVAVRDGVATLTGTVPTYAEKCAAERAARRVAGVQAIAEEIRVEPRRCGRTSGCRRTSRPSWKKGGSPSGAR